MRATHLKRVKAREMILEAKQTRRKCQSVPRMMEHIGLEHGHKLSELMMGENSPGRA